MEIVVFIFAAVVIAMVTAFLYHMWKQSPTKEQWDNASLPHVGRPTAFGPGVKAEGTAETEPSESAENVPVKVRTGVFMQLAFKDHLGQETARRTSEAKVVKVD